MNFMSWDAIEAISSAITMLATIIGLVFVYIQISNLVRSQHALTVQNIASSEREIWRDVLDDPAMLSLTVHHLGFSDDDLKKLDLQQSAIILLIFFFRQYETIYYQHKHNMLPDNLWDQWEWSMKNTFGNDDVFLVFDKARVGFSKEFKLFITAKIRNDNGKSK